MRVFTLPGLDTIIYRRLVPRRHCYSLTNFRKIESRISFGREEGHGKAGEGRESYQLLYDHTAMFVKIKSRKYILNHQTERK